MLKHTLKCQCARDFDICELIFNTINKYENKNIIFDSNSKIIFTGRKTLIRRCINNFIDNSIKSLTLLPFFFLYCLF